MTFQIFCAINTVFKIIIMKETLYIVSVWGRRGVIGYKGFSFHSLRIYCGQITFGSTWQHNVFCRCHLILYSQGFGSFFNMASYFKVAQVEFRSPIILYSWFLVLFHQKSGISIRVGVKRPPARQGWKSPVTFSISGKIRYGYGKILFSRNLK